MTFLETSLFSWKINSAPAKNYFSVSLPDPCNIMINVFKIIKRLYFKDIVLFIIYQKRG